MLDHVLKHLDEIAQSHPLDGLEARVWTDIENHLSRVVLGWQSAVVAFTLASSIGLGASAVTGRPPSNLGVFSLQAPLAPSMLLKSH